MWGKRTFVQLASALLQNLHLKGFFTKLIYKGSYKKICVPGLNCYSCPAATGSCPIGAFQSVANDFKYSFSFYATGFILLFGSIFGRAICGWVCPFGLYQDLLYKIPSKKKKLHKNLSYGKYLILLIFVIVFPIFWQNDFGLGKPTFCEYICPAGTLEAGIPLLFLIPSLQNLIGILFYFKLFLLIAFSALSIRHYRFFCKAICPLGALYAPANKISFLQIEFSQDKCINCQKCENVCKMDIDIKENQKNLECIRCGDCIKSCPTNALKFTTPFAPKNTVQATEPTSN